MHMITKGIEFMSKVICHTFVLVAPTKAHGESDA